MNPSSQELAWRTSSYTGSGENCVEVAPLPGGAGGRDTKDRGGPVLYFTTGQWRDLLSRVRRGEVA